MQLGLPHTDIPQSRLSASLWKFIYIAQTLTNKACVDPDDPCSIHEGLIRTSSLHHVRIPSSPIGVFWVQVERAS